MKEDGFGQPRPFFSNPPLSPLFIKNEAQKGDFLRKVVTLHSKSFEKQNKSPKTMALAIANIPVLEGAEAEAFVRMANENLKRRGTVEIGMSDETFYNILEKSRRARAAFHASKRV